MSDRDSSVGRATAAVASAQWDVEEGKVNGLTSSMLNLSILLISFFCKLDHLLSYFLGGESSQNNTTDADTAVERNEEPRPNNDHGDLIHGSSSAPALEQSNSYDSKSPDGILRRSTSMGKSSLSVHFLDNIPEEPKSFNDLSVMQDQSNSHGSMPTMPSTASSSASSLSTMAAAMAIGGPNQTMYIHQKLQGRVVPSSSTEQLNSTSPITPVNMLCSPAGQEQMMLPPPPRFPSGNGFTGMNVHQNYIQHPDLQSSQSMQMQSQWNQQQQQQQFQYSPQTQQHLTWIQQMNEACLAAQQQQAFQQPQPQTQNVNGTNPSPVPNLVVSQSQQAQSTPFQAQQPNTQQIQVGVDGATVPVTAVTNPDGTVSYHIDPNTAAVPKPALRYLTKAINEVVKPEDPDKEDPAVLAEKRQRRLARNRESARNSRRRKKELLNSLAQKVQKLQRQLDTEITSQIQSMETGISELKSSLLQQYSKGANADKESICLMIRSTSPNCSIRRDVILHQYNCLRQGFLSTQNHCSVWLMMKNSQFFTDGCRASQKMVESKGNKTGTSRPNSKQVGEDIMKSENTGETPVSSSSEDSPRMWPLLCHELTMTMDQEEKVINQAHVE